MNFKLIILMLAIAVISACNTTKKEASLNGTWQLSTYQYGDQPEQTVPETGKRIKLIADHHFTWIQYDTNNKIVMNSAGGAIQFDGTNYVESIDFCHKGMITYLDNRQHFTVKLDENKMYLEGMLSDSLKIKEVWLKLE